jgi:hypothetical protein
MKTLSFFVSKGKEFGQTLKICRTRKGPRQKNKRVMRPMITNGKSIKNSTNKSKIILCSSSPRLYYKQMNRNRYLVFLFVNVLESDRVYEIQILRFSLSE